MTCAKFDGNLFTTFKVTVKENFWLTILWTWCIYNGKVSHTLTFRGFNPPVCFSRYWPRSVLWNKQSTTSFAS